MASRPNPIDQVQDHVVTVRLEGAAAGLVLTAASFCNLTPEQFIKEAMETALKRQVDLMMTEIRVFGFSVMPN